VTGIAVDRSERDLQAALAAACLAASALCVVAWVTTRSPSLAAVSLTGVLLAGAWASLVGARPAVIAASLCVAPPGIIGENYGELALLAFAVMWLAVWSAPAERAPAFPLVPVLIGGEALAFVASSPAAPAASAHVRFVIAMLYGAAAIVAYELAKRPTLARDSMRALTMLISVLCASYLLSVAVGFAGSHHLQLPFRTATLAPPATLVGGSAANYLSTPRFLVLSGEPGLGGIYLLVATGGALMLERGRRRVLLLALLGAGCAAAQSTGLIIGLMAMACAVAFVFVTRRVAVIAAVAAMFVLLPSALAVSNLLVERKEGFAPLSVTDRGLTGGDATGAISLSGAWPYDPIIVVPLVVLLAYVAYLCVREPVPLGLVVGVAVIAWFAQPFHYHPGVWVMLFLAALLAPLGERGESGEQATPSDPLVAP
jgi:hypothetical protein